MNSSAMDILSQIDSYFASVSAEELARDLEAAEFEFYNQIGEPVLTPQKLGSFAAVAVASGAETFHAWEVAVAMRPLPDFSVAGNYESNRLAA